MLKKLTESQQAQIIDKAVLEFAEKGYKGAGLSTIARNAGVSVGVIYKYYADKGALVPNYNYLPDDHYAILGAQFQKYLAGKSDRKGFAKDVTTYWKTKTLEPHEN